MAHQNEIPPRLRPIDLILLVVSSVALGMLAVIVWQRLHTSPLPAELNAKDSGESTLRSIAAPEDSQSLTLPDESQDTQSEKFTIELGQARSESEASAKISELQKQGLEAFFTPLSRTGRVIYRIRSGIFDREEEAEAESKRLSQKGLSPTISRL